MQAETKLKRTTATQIKLWVVSRFAFLHGDTALKEARNPI